MSGYPPFGLDYPRTELQRELVAAVLAGEKTATSGLLVAIRFRAVEVLA